MRELSTQDNISTSDSEMDVIYDTIKESAEKEIFNLKEEISNLEGKIVVLEEIISNPILDDEDEYNIRDEYYTKGTVTFHRDNHTVVFDNDSVNWDDDYKTPYCSYDSHYGLSPTDYEIKNK